MYLAVQTFGDDESKDVQRAVKLLRDGASLSDKEEFTREAEIMTVMEHPNIVQIVGTCMVYRPWLVVLEMMQYGDLKKVLLACQHKEMEVSFIELLVMAEQVAAALEYVAGKGFVHMDVCCKKCTVAHKQPCQAFRLRHHAHLLTLTRANSGCRGNCEWRFDGWHLKHWASIQSCSLRRQTFTLTAF